MKTFQVDMTWEDGDCHELFASVELMATSAESAIRKTRWACIARGWFEVEDDVAFAAVDISSAG